jgi:hypothetical protein
MLCRRKGRALEISFVGSVFVYKEILIKMEPEETVVAVVEDQQLVEIYLERCGSQKSKKYKTRIELPPRKPNSSPTVEKIKSVWCSGKKLYCT